MLERMIELLTIEHECMLRNSHGDCDRKCEDCDLVQDDGELHEMYTDVIGLLKKQEPMRRTSRTGTNGFSIVWTCGNCNSDLKPNNRNALYCSQCGQAVKWDG